MLSNTLMLLAAIAVPLPAAARPNIVVIMADDMGFSDLGCYGGEINTPNLDALAAGGLRFTQFYNTARCCPTRASLLTGLYPHQAGVGHMLQETGKPGYTSGLNRAGRTFAEVLGPAGYGCYAVGKWHVTKQTRADGPKNNWPLGRGFDRFYGTIHGAGSFFDPSSLVRDETMISAFADPEYQPSTYYYTDAISDHAVRFLADHHQQEAHQPFFLYVAYTAAHWPMHALPEDIAKYAGKYDAGYAAIRQARLEKAARLGLVDASQGMAPPARAWDAVADKKWEAAGMEVYAAMVDRMDQGIGKIVAELRRTGALDNTLILYLQDNGGCAEGMGRRPQKNHPNIPRPAKPTLRPMEPTDFAAAGSVPLQTRDGYPVRMGSKVIPGPADTYLAYGEGWANVSNTPFREYKHWVHEGGISTPLIAHWPAGIAARGELRRQPGHLIDIMATCVSLAGADYPPEALPLEGGSLVPAFADQPIERKALGTGGNENQPGGWKKALGTGGNENQPGGWQNALYWEHEGNRAVRVGDWKLVAKHGGAWELYDLAHDRTEAKDLAAAHPEKVKQLSDLYTAWAARANVEPWPVPGT